MSIQRRISTCLKLILSGVLCAVAVSYAQTVQDPPFGRPDAVVDLGSRDGVQLIQGQWRYHDVSIIDADSRAVGPDLRPSGAPTQNVRLRSPCGIVGLRRFRVGDNRRHDTRPAPLHCQSLLQLVPHQHHHP